MIAFYSCIDATFPAPQNEQSKLISEMAKNNDGEILFYGSEEYRVVSSQPYIMAKLLRTPGIDGVIFFTINQFCYGSQLNLKLLTNILKAGFKIGFARENIFFSSWHDVDEHLPMLIAHFYDVNRKLKKDYLQFFNS